MAMDIAPAGVDIAAVTATTATATTAVMDIAAGTAVFVPDGEAGIAMEADMPSGPEGVTLAAEAAWVADLAEASTAVAGSTAVVADFMVAAVEDSTAAATGKFH